MTRVSTSALGDTSPAESIFAADEASTSASGGALVLRLSSLKGGPAVTRASSCPRPARASSTRGARARQRRVPPALRSSEGRVDGVYEPAWACPTVYQKALQIPP